MARLLVSTAVAVGVGAFLGPQAGFAAFSATYGLTGFLDPTQKVKGPRLDDVKGTTASYGTPIAWVKGNPRVAGAIVWCSDKQEVAHTQEQGGKGGPSAESTTYTYKIDVRILLSANIIPGVRRVWSNGKLVWSAAGDANTIAASAETDAWERMTVYTGAADQMPDPVEEAALGIENCPAYRGRGSVFIEGLNLGGSGYLPNLTFEIGEGSISAGDTIDFVCTAEGEGEEFVVPGYTVAMSGTGYLQAAISPAEVITGPYQGSKMAYARGMASIGALVSGTYIDNGPFTLSGAFWFDEPYGAFDNIYLFRFYDNEGTPVPFFGVRRDVSDDDTQRRWAIEFFGEETTTAWAFPGGGAHPSNGWTPYEVSYNGAGLVTFSVGGSPVLSLSRTPDGSSREMSQVAWGVLADMSSERFAWDDIAVEISMGSEATESLTPEPLEDVLTELCVRSGIPESYVDFSSCSGQLVRALAVTQVTPARQVMEMLGGAYLQEFVEGAGLKTVARGGASVATLPYDDLGASSGDPVEPLPLKRLNDIELPRQFAITYANVLNDYQNGTEYSDRLLGGSTSVAATELPLGLQPQEAKRIADCKLLDAVAGIIQIGPVGITRAYARLEPADVITLTDHEGSTFRSRVVKITDDGGLRTLELVQDDASAVNSSAVTDDDYESSNIVRSRASTLMELLDIPILRDADNDAGHYVAITKSSNNGTWAGAALYQGLNDAGYSEIARFTDRTFIGVTTTDLPAWAGGNVFDEVNTVTVSGVGELSSYTRDAIISGSANGYLIGSRVIYAQTATLVSPGVYTLSGLLHGRRGTEWASEDAVAAGARVVLLQTQGMRHISMTAAQVGVEYDYKAVTFGASVGAVTAEPFTNEAVGLKPFSPADLRCSRDGSGGFTITWARRSRLDSSVFGTVPLGESSEAYEVDILDGDDVVRTISATSQSAQYTPAQQVADFGSVQSSIDVAVYQMSATVGRGYPLTGTLSTSYTPTGQVNTVTLAGTFASGVPVSVYANGALIASRTSVGGDTNLAGMATGLASVIDATANYAASAVGSVVTVTGPLGSTYTLTAIVGGSSAISVLKTQDAAVANPGTSYRGELYIANLATGITDPVPAGVTLRVTVKENGLTVSTFEYTTTASMSKDSALAGLIGAFADTTLGDAGYSMNMDSTTAGGSFAVLSGPVGTEGISLTTYGTAPWGLSVSVQSEGSPAVAENQPQIVQVTVSGTPANGEVFRVTLGGENFTYTATVPSDTREEVIDGFVAVIDADADYTSAQLTASKLEAAGVVIGDFSYSVGITRGITATVA